MCNIKYRKPQLISICYNIYLKQQYCKMTNYNPEFLLE